MSRAAVILLVSGLRTWRVLIRTALRLDCTRGLPRSCCACTSGPAAPDDDSAQLHQSRGRARGEGPRLRRGHRNRSPPRSARCSCPLSYFPVDPAFKRTGGAARCRSDRPVFDMPTSTGHDPEDAARRRPRVHAAGQGDVARIVRRGRARSRSTSLFVPFADLTTGMDTYSAGTLSRLEADRDGLLRDRLQSRLQPDLRLQPDVGMSVSTSGEPPQGGDPRRREERQEAPPQGPGRVTSALQAIVFDFDGVIADSEPLHLQAFQQALAEEGVVLEREDYFSPLSRLRRRRRVRRRSRGTAASRWTDRAHHRARRAQRNEAAGDARTR